ncbi:MAG: hypothetical protein OEV56_03620, partial [Dehalococcoidia bacterium]|nr:hypothetical protein [Dehalococcoidia bacterium]
TASAFSDPGPGEYQIAAQWQIKASTGSYSDPVFDSGNDTVNLTSITIPAGVLNDSSSYCWRVRYQGSLGAWSQYSSETCFYTRPVAAVYSNTPVCAGQTIQLFGGPSGMNYSWTGPLGFTSDLQRPTINSTTVPMTGSYNLTVTAPNGCSDTTSTYVTVQSCTSPPPNTPTNQSPGSAACVDLPVILTASDFSDSGQYQVAAQWQIRAGGGGYSDPVFDFVKTTGPFTSITIPAGILSDASSYFWHVRYQGNGGTWSEYSAETFFGTKPVATASSSSPVCVNQTIHLYGGPGGMAIYYWAGPNGFSSSLQNPTIPNAAASNAGTYNLTVTAPNGCSDTASTTVTVQTCATPPSRPANISPSAGTCVGLPVTLTASAFSDSGPQIAAQWQIRASTGSYSDPVFDSGTDTLHLASIGIPLGTLSDASSYYWHVRYQGTDGWSEYSSETFFCTNPVAAASSGAPAYVGGIVQLFGGPDGMASYSWTGPNGFSSGLQNPVIPNASLAMAGTYTLTVTTVNDCTDVASISVTVSAVGAAVGWETRSIDKLRLLLPWIGLLTTVIVGMSLLVVRRRRV